VGKGALLRTVATNRELFGEHASLTLRHSGIAGTRVCSDHDATAGPIIARKNGSYIATFAGALPIA
jgi:hypothetical protein